MGWLRNPDPFLRFQERIVKVEGGCWLWQGKLNRHGYAAFKINGRVVAVHRWAYETYKGPIPEGLVIDHLCKSRSCVNPDHLETVTVKENNRRAKTHCFQAGHPFTEENSLILSNGSRICRLCHLERKNKYRERSYQERQGVHASDPDVGTTKTILVITSSGFDDGLLILELEMLKQRGLIKNFMWSESAPQGDSITGM